MIFKIVKNNIIGITIGIIGLISSILSYLVPWNLDDKSISNRYVVFIITIALIIICTEYVIIKKVKEYWSSESIFKVVMFNNKIDQFIIECKGEIQVNTLLGVYYKYEEYHEILGL